MAKHFREEPDFGDDVADATVATIVTGPEESDAPEAPESAEFGVASVKFPSPDAPADAPIAFGTTGPKAPADAPVDVQAGSVAPKSDVPADEAQAAAAAKMRALEAAEDAIEAAFLTGRADRASITKTAQDSAQEAVRLVGDAMEADERADESLRLAVIAESLGNRAKRKRARKRVRDAKREAKQAHRAATRSARGAYEAIKFSQPGKLGLMRAVQGVYAINIVLTLLALIMTSRDTITYDSVTIMSWVTIILEGVGFWFFVNAFKVTKPYVIVVSLFQIAVQFIMSLANGSFSPFEASTDTVYHVLLILYFLFSKRVDAVLVNDFASFKPKEQQEFKIKRGGWAFVRNLIIYFVVFSVLGHWMEAAMCQLIRLGLVKGEYDPSNTMLWRDWLYPYPMEGAAVVIIALVLYPLWQQLLKKCEKPLHAYVISFVANALTCSLIEFSMGLIVNANHQLWDYRDMTFNIMGQVCLQNTLAFGVAASIIAWVVYPAMERAIARVPFDTMNIVFVIVAVIGGILWSLYIIDPPENHKYLETQIMGDDQLNPEPILTLDERDGIKLTLGALEEGETELSRQINGTQNISDEKRDELNRKLDELESDLAAIKETLALDEAA